jgi:hypothetical protein
MAVLPSAGTIACHPRAGKAVALRGEIRRARDRA